MRAHLVVNRHRLDAVQSAQETTRWLLDHGVEVGAELEVAEPLGVECVSEARMPHADFLVCFGGDGTLMRAANMVSEFGTPILGVYFGRFGFVTQIEGHELPRALEAILAGKARTEERMMLRTELLRGGESIATIHAINETVLQRAVTARMMVFSVMIDGTRVTSYPADGVMVATATGSTAYNLSAGGPIVDPEVQAMLLTAIAPHTLSARTLVLRPESEIRLKVQTEGDAVLSADGQDRLHLLSGDEVVISRSERVSRLITLSDDDFLEKLADKLFWGHSVERGPAS